jgi:deoxyribodipyrimidine photo-lyase
MATQSIDHLIWFRNDLRVHDNQALVAACKNAAVDGGSVAGVFIVAKGQWQQHHLSPGRMTLTHEALSGLSTSLKALNVPLIVHEVDVYKQVPDKLRDLAYQLKVKHIYFNHEYGVDEARRDEAVRHQLSDQNMHGYHGSVLLKPGTVRTLQGQIYKVFTPFRNRVLDTLRYQDMLPLSKPKALAPKTFSAEIEQVISQNGLELFQVTPVDISSWASDESTALSSLSDFVSERVDDYRDTRDFPSIEGTSKLSAAMNVGLLSPRQCLQAATQGMPPPFDGISDGVRTWIGELIWREFYLHVMWGFPKICKGLAFKADTENVPWRHDVEEFERWKSGTTGFPMVDAAMHQLNSTGWMHNRLRMLTATFLSKHLLIDWRWGERYFMSQLIDGHFASNNGGWQWAASTGTDAAPYFRFLSPTRQSQRFDVQGVYIKHWIPALADVPSKVLHKPGHQQLLDAGYPEPMVDLAEARERCLAAFRG